MKIYSLSRMNRFLAPALVVASMIAPIGAFAQTVVPPGNRHAEQPGVPTGSSSRTQALKTSYEAKYRKVFALLQNDEELRRKIIAEARAYGIDPMHIVGAIVGEHTYNVDAYDRLQTYYVKAAAYLGSSFSFSYDGEDISEFVNRPQFSDCGGDSYELWSCRERVWDREFRGKNVGGADFPDNRFSAVFFQPFYAGQTFGIGQLNPLTALQVSDIVSRVSGFPKLSEREPSAIYETIMNPDLTLAYVAATIRKSVDSYRDIAGFDISQNPGITATLYNVGNPEARAYALKAENEGRVAKSEEPRMPEENYYGWLVNEKLPELQALF